MKLLVRNPRERLGAVPPRSKGSSSQPNDKEAGPNSAKFVMDHPFFEVDVSPLFFITNLDLLVLNRKSIGKLH
jgi:hypothetical protein